MTNAEKFFDRLDKKVFFLFNINTKIVILWSGTIFDKKVFDFQCNNNLLT